MIHDEPSDQPVATSAIRIYAVILTVSTLCALAIVLVYEFTRPIIERNRQLLRQQAVLQVLPGAVTSQLYYWNESTRSLSLGNDAQETAAGSAEEVIFAGFNQQEELVGVAIQAEGMGYQDVIRVLYGYSYDADAVIGIRILESRETPGLGDRIEKDTDFLSNFAALDVRLDESGAGVANQVVWVKSGSKSQPWQIDGITGATISSRAVADMIGNSTAAWMPRLHGKSQSFAIQKGEVK